MRIGVIGAGVIGRLRARSVRENPATELAAVMDVSVEAARSAVAGSKAQALGDLAAFFAVPMDAVFVSTPPHLHEEACVKAFELGRHVLCEKPLANSVEGCRRIVEAAKRADRVLAVGFNIRYYPAFRFVKDAIDSGKIGKLDHVRLFGGHEGLPKFRIDWQYKAPESGGGAMWDVGVHLTDVARWLLGEITSVYGVMTGSVWKVPGSEDNAIAVFRNPEGITASYHATWIEWKGYQFCVEAYGDRGMVRGFYAPMENLLITQDQPGGPTRKKRLRYPWIIVREKLLTWHSTALITFREELRDFLAMIGGRNDVRLADGYAGLRSVEVADAVRRSTESGEVVQLPVLGRMRT
jgi:predicted dehydrogenase